MLDDTSQFYTQLPMHSRSLGDLLVSTGLFQDIPADWHIIITDIKDSTRAVFEGRHQDVNLIATGSIVSVLNLAFAMEVTVPFFFGGDGATFIVPPVLIDKAMQALTIFKTNTRDNFGLELRTGTVAVKDVYEHDHHIKIAKFSATDVFTIPIILGNGLNYAERLVKGDDYMFADTDGGSEELDLTGMQCRWDKIAPPQNRDEVISLLVVARDGESQSDVFKEVMDAIDTIYGSPQKRQPISVDQLKFNTTFNKLGTEMRVRIGRIKWLEFLRTWLLSLYGYIYFGTSSGKRYLESLVQMADTLVIDGKINTVMSGKAKQRAELEKVLDKLEAQGKLVYGMFISQASVMSCYVRDLKDDHIHFVDGAEGGYTQAAKMLKAKLKALPPINL
ncbi:DUF3095 domain-containing protein [Mucilaginibacter terrenus]|uniref:DUF3095 domain-containing protein n=1 Tax=Mucilaginibacter terrenus TaxID=2482727 RepID=A0A3E2NXB9_9SPHI|nr:DUF3095 domain-containing protein [Mucilaginibacter terrenus]RFZ85589.1 DUF3095 domain-containing protein [Mucilaginibacter terrenus]